MLTAEAEVFCAPAMVHESVAEIKQVVDPAMQLRMLNGLQSTRETQGDYCDALFDFAADPEASASVLARAYALGLCLEGVFNSVPMVGNGGEPAQPIPAYLRSFYADMYQRILAREFRHSPHGSWRANDPSECIRKIAAEEGVVEQSLRGGFFNTAFDLVEWFAEEIGHTTPTSQFSADTVRAALSYALDRPRTPVEKLSEVEDEFIRLNQLVSDRSGGHSLELLRSHLGDQEALAYAQVLNRLHESVSGLADIFPPELGENIVDGARRLVGSALFAITRHASQKKQTNAQVVLLSGRAIDVKLTEDEPLILLQDLDRALRKLHSEVAGEDSRPVLCAQGEGFKQYRFVNKTSALPPTVALYLRPLGAYRYDEAREYGRPGKGVDASISYTVQLGDDASVPLTRREQQQRLDIISVRTDRDGTQDPTQSGGRIALDIGSILGPEGALGTRVGLFLAWGEMLEKSMNFEDDYAPNLNHIPLRSQQYGYSDYFASLAVDQDRRVDAGRIGEKGIRQIYCSRGAGRSATTAVVASMNI